MNKIEMLGEALNLNIMGGIIHPFSRAESDTILQNIMRGTQSNPIYVTIKSFHKLQIH